jgi:hypothetical protein
VDQIDVLTEWFVNHVDRAPGRPDKEDLAAETGLSSTQVGDWMANTRRRVLTKLKQGADPQNLIEYRIGLALAREEEKNAYSLAPEKQQEEDEEDVYDDKEYVM